MGKDSRKTDSQVYLLYTYAINLTTTINKGLQQYGKILLKKKRAHFKLCAFVPLISFSGFVLNTLIACNFSLKGVKYSSAMRQTLILFKMPVNPKGYLKKLLPSQR